MGTNVCQSVCLSFCLSVRRKKLNSKFLLDVCREYSGKHWKTFIYKFVNENRMGVKIMDDLFEDVAVRKNKWSCNKGTKR